MVERTNKNDVTSMDNPSTALNIREIQQISLEILKIIAKVCEEQNYRYTLAFGTLIGAIRHKGFIPWDDDVDIMMPRPDYDRLLTYMTNHPLEHIKVFNYKNVKNYPLGISRICDMRYRICDPKIQHVDMGIFVDVYPLDGLANTYDEAKKAFNYTDKARANLLRMGMNKSPKICWKQLFTQPRYFLSEIKLRILGLYKIQGSLEQKARRYSFEDCKYVGVPNWNWAHIVFQRDWFNDFMRVPFEDGEFNIITHYDEMLREEYGDYMQLPPVEKRVYHHGYIAYKR